MKQLTDEQRALLREPNYAVATTLRPDGSPQSTVVWVDIDDDGAPTFNTARGRASRKYDGEPWTYRPGEERIKIRVLPEHIATYS